MSGASTGEYQAHYLGMSGACLEYHLGHHLEHMGHFLDILGMGKASFGASSKAFLGRSKFTCGAKCISDANYSMYLSNIYYELDRVNCADSASLILKLMCL